MTHHNGDTDDHEHTDHLDGTNGANGTDGTDPQRSEAAGPAGRAADAERTAGGLDTEGTVDDGMGADAPADAAGEDEPVPGIDDDPRARAHRS